MVIRNKKLKATRKLSSVSNLSKRIYITKTSRHIYLSLFCRELNRDLFSVSTLTSDNLKANHNNSASAKKLANDFVSKYDVNTLGKAFFDRRTHSFHGNVKIVADILRQNNIIT